MELGTCSECGDAFAIKGMRTKTCSPECSIKRGGRHPYRVVTKPGTCSECDGPILRHEVSGKRVTCGPECATARSRRLKIEKYAASRPVPAQRSCLDCPIDISHRRANCVRCHSCQDLYRRRKNRALVAAAWEAVPTDERRRRRLESRLKAIYGIDFPTYEAMLKEQGGCCAICGNPPHGRGRTNGLVVDHDHATGAARGLLCGNCNTGIGLLDESPDVLTQAVRYLARRS